MLCSNCGKDIPIVGNVCPYCHVDKRGDQALKLMTLTGLGIGAAISFLIVHMDFVPGFGLTCLIAAPFVAAGYRVKRNAEKK